MEMYFDFPDVVFSKGGSPSCPPVLAARILGIPIIIHESDAAPGKANVWAEGLPKNRVSLVQAEYFQGQKIYFLSAIRLEREFFISFRGEGDISNWKTAFYGFCFRRVQAREI